MAGAVRAVRPWAVKVNSGVGVAGADDPQRVADFIRAAAFLSSEGAG